MRKRDKITYQNQTLPVGQWAHDQSSMTPELFLSRLRRGWTMGQLLGDEPPPLPAGSSRGRRGRPELVLEHNGLKLTLKEWAELAGIPKTTLVNRMNKRWTIAQLLGEVDPPPASRPCRVGTPEERALVQVRKNLEAARPEIARAGTTAVAQTVARRVRTLVAEESRLARLIGIQEMPMTKKGRSCDGIEHE